jgi:O-phosphoseryl-tRNA(Sec) kinase
MLVRVSIVLFSGLPGVGKTTLANGFEEYVNSQQTKHQFVESLLISYDKVIEKSVENELVASNEWKSSRNLNKNLAQHLIGYLQKSDRNKTNFKSYLATNFDQLSSQNPNIFNSITEKFANLVESSLNSSTRLNKQTNQEEMNHFVIILDDNFYYESMRYEFFKLARDLNECSFYCLCLKASDLSVLLSRNSNRIGEARLEDSVIKQMWSKFEGPGSNSDYEREFCRIESPDDVSFEELLDSIIKSHSKFRDFIHEKKEQELNKAESLIKGHESAKNLVHACDLILRKLVNAKLGELRKSNTADLALSSRKVLEKKAAILSILKNSESDLYNKVAGLNGDLKLVENALANEIFKD